MERKGLFKTARMSPSSLIDKKPYFQFHKFWRHLELLLKQLLKSENICDFSIATVSTSLVSLGMP